MNQKEFNKDKFKTVKTTVAVIITKGDKILLTKRSPNMKREPNKWCIPGGHMEIGETPEKAVKRETKEEIKLDIKNLKFLFYYNEYMPKLKIHAVSLIFKAITYDKPKKSDEVSESKWFTKKEIKKLKMAFTNKRILTKFFNIKK